MRAEKNWKSITSWKPGMSSRIKTCERKCSWGRGGGGWSLDLTTNKSLVILAKTLVSELVNQEATDCGRLRGYWKH